MVGLGQRELRPIHRAVFKILDAQTRTRDLLSFQRVFGVLAPLVGGGHDQAAGKWRLARRRKEAVDVGFLDAIAASIELALNGAPIVGAVGELRDEINETTALAVWGDNGPVIVRWERPRRPITVNVVTGTTLGVLSSAAGRVAIH